LLCEGSAALPGRGGVRTSGPVGRPAVSAFEYLSVFISIILGLAVVHLLGGVSLIIDQRVRARLDAIHLLWVLNMFTLITWVWWGNWQLNDVIAFSPVHYVAMVLFSVVVYLMCGLLFPVRGKEVEDFQEQFEMNRSRFFYLGLSLWPSPPP
jgi:hypothetical protein